MEIKQQRHDGVTVIAPAGRIDSTTSETLERTVAGTLDAGERRVIIDLKAVDYISSAGLRVLLLAAKRLGGGRGALVLCNLGDPVRQVFDLAGFLPLFTIEPSRELAVKRAAGAA
jgi:anti-anti-sigma factor